LNDRRNLTLGIVLLGLGAFLLLSRTLRFSGPGAVLVLIGAILLALSAARGFRGPLLPGGILLGLGGAFLCQAPLERLFPRWATITFGLGLGFLLVGVVDRAARHERRPSPLVPGLILLAVSFFGALSRLTPVTELLVRVRDLWPWALVIAGLALIAQAFLRRHRT
jgi:hypothetical protein